MMNNKNILLIIQKVVKKNNFSSHFATLILIIWLFAFLVTW